MKNLLLPACGFIALTLVVRIDRCAASDDDFPDACLIAKDIGETNIKNAHLLAFGSRIDDRPLYVESALVAIERNDGGWRLAHIYRHPKENRERAKQWSLSIVFDAPVHPDRKFDHCPTKAEIERFIADSRWKFEATSGFRLLRGEVFTETWEKVFGYKPDHRFPKPDA